MRRNGVGRGAAAGRSSGVGGGAPRSAGEESVEIPMVATTAPSGSSTSSPPSALESGGGRGGRGPSASQLSAPSQGVRGAVRTSVVSVGRSARMADVDTELPGIDEPSLTAWLEQQLAITRPVRFRLIAGGRSNLTYTVEDAAGRRLVLRRPPLSHVIAPPTTWAVNTGHHSVDCDRGPRAAPTAWRSVQTPR